MRPQPITVHWPREQLAAALCAVEEEQAHSPMAKRRMQKRFRTLMKRGRLAFEDMDTEWVHRLCRASLMLHQYHWTGWEWRSEWATEVCTKSWAWPRWDGSKCRVLVVAEQGLGDEILFASCYNDLARDVEEAWIECDDRLQPIFSRSFPGNLHFVSRYLYSERRVVPRMGHYPACHADKPIDAFVPAGNVPKLYRHSAEDFPQEPGFLQPDPYQVKAWRAWLSQWDPPWKGVSWTGRQGTVEGLRRREFFSLQYGEEPGPCRRVPIDMKWSIDEVFNFMAALDRVVTTTNAVAHMAGALGCPTDVVLPPAIYATEENGWFNNLVQPFFPKDRNDFYPSFRMWRNFNEWKANQ